MAIEIVDFPMKNGGSFHSYLYVHQRFIMDGWFACPMTWEYKGHHLK